MASDRGGKAVAAGYLAHLMGCVLSERVPDGLPAGCSWADVTSNARENSILGLVWHAARVLDGIPDDVRESCQRFSDMVALHNVRYEAEREAICAALRAEGLSVLPLKGAGLVSRYPDYSMREVGDNDLLYGFVDADADGSLHGRPDPDGSLLARAQGVARRVMEGLEYELVAGPDRVHMEFCKDPGLCFELHHALFDDLVPFRVRYDDPWRFARVRRGALGVTPAPDHPAGFELGLPPEDEYVYLMAHAYKHSVYRGFGLRTLADVVVMLGVLGDGANWSYVDAQLEELDISGFAARLRGLAVAVRDGAPLTGDQLDAVMHMMLSGTYGNDAKAYRIRMRRYALEGCSPRLAELSRFFSFDSVRGLPEFSVFRDHLAPRPLFQSCALSSGLANLFVTQPC